MIFCKFKIKLPRILKKAAHKLWNSDLMTSPINIFVCNAFYVNWVIQTYFEKQLTF